MIFQFWIWPVKRSYTWPVFSLLVGFFKVGYDYEIICGNLKAKATRLSGLPYADNHIGGLWIKKIRPTLLVATTFPLAQLYKLASHGTLAAVYKTVNCSVWH